MSRQQDSSNWPLVLIMAGGDNTRWVESGGAPPKEVAPVGGVPVILRTIRILPPECRAVVVSHKTEVIARVWEEAEIDPVLDRYIVGHLYRWRDEWAKRNVVLFADVAYTKEMLAQVFACAEPLWWFGRDTELFAMVWRKGAAVRNLMERTLKLAGNMPGKWHGRCWNAYWLHTGRQFGTFAGPKYFTEVPEPVADMDTIEDYERVKVAFEGAVA